MFLSWLHISIGALVLVFGLSTGLHALMNRRDPPAAVGWTVFCVIVPVVGAMLYLMMGVNRIKTKAKRWQKRGRFDPGTKRDYESLQAELAHEHPERAERVAALLAISNRVTGRPLLAGNRVEPLANGEQAYPQMLEAIGNADKTVYLCSYLFDSDELGMRFVDALGATAARGVDVRVMVDAIGERYGPGAIVSKYLSKRNGVKIARFLPLSISPRSLSINLRSHRKIMVVDSRLGFTGGMNIGKNNLVDNPDTKHKIADLHFRLEGPIAYTMEDVFLEDWYFCTGETVPPPSERGPMEPCGPAICRGISDGPNEDYEVLTWILVGVLSVARERVRIMTPYFIPSRELLSALNAAALRGVRVDVILPEKGNLALVDWAGQDRLQDVLQYGIRVHRQPPPFNHTKLLVMDDFYINMGSANLDPRSLRLNFEFNVEIFDNQLAAELARRYDETLSRSREVTLDMLQQRGFFTKLRDSLAKLLSPYL